MDRLQLLVVWVKVSINQLQLVMK